MSTNYNRLLEDSGSNKILIFFREDALYSKLIKIGNQDTETILIKDVYDNYVASIDENDNVFVACYTKENNIALISYNDSHWELEDTITTPKEVDIVLLELFNIKGVIHIIYATYLPIKNYYNIYHIYFTNNAWKKENIAEIHSYNLLGSYSCSISSDGVIHFISVYNDRKSYFIKHSSFNDSMKWISNIVSSLNNNNIHLNLLNDSKNLHLICYSSEEKIFIYYYFISKGTNCDSFEFEFITKFRLADIILKPVFYILNDSIFMALISGENYCEYILNDKIKEWEPYLKLPLSNKINHIALVVYNNRFLDRGYYCFFDESSKLLLPINKLFNNANDEKDFKKAQQDYYVPYLLDQIKQLSEEIKAFSTKLNEIETAAPSKENNCKNVNVSKAQSDNKVNIKAKNLMNHSEQNMIQKKNMNSNFKQTFMKDDKLLRNLDSKFAANFLEASKNNNHRPISNNSKISYANGRFLNSFQNKESYIPELNMKSITKAKSSNSDDASRKLKSSPPANELVSQGEHPKSVNESDAINKQVELPNMNDEVNELNKSNFPGLIKKIGDLFK